MLSGDFTAGATPVPIPNTAVKPCEVDGTAPFGCGRVDSYRFYFKPVEVENTSTGFLFYWAS